MISVCIPTYNGAKYIKEQLDSILIQINQYDEIIISDDSSTDETINIIKSYSDSRIKLFLNNTFNSPIFNLENALKQASGDYIFLADQDDIWHKNKVATILPLLNTNDLVVSDSYIINDNGDVGKSSFFKIVKAKKGFFHNFRKNGYLGCALAFNRKILNYVIPFPKNIAMHDIWIGLNTEIIGKPYFLNQKLLYYRRHNENSSSAAEKSIFPFYYQIWYRIVFLKEISVRYIERKILKYEKKN